MYKLNMLKLQKQLQMEKATHQMNKEKLQKNNYYNSFKTINLS